MEEDEEGGVVSCPRCSICQEVMLLGGSSQSCVTHCGHMYHVDCISEWCRSKRGKATCPECRCPTKMRDLTPVYLELEKVEKENEGEIVPSGSKADDMLEKYKEDPGKMEKLCRWLFGKRGEDAAKMSVMDAKKAELDEELDLIKAETEELRKDLRFTVANLSELEMKGKSDQEVITSLKDKLKESQSICAQMEERFRSVELFESAQTWADNPESGTGELDLTCGNISSCSKEELYSKLQHFHIANKVLMKEHRRLKKVKDETTLDNEMLQRQLQKAKQSVLKKKEKISTLAQFISENMYDDAEFSRNRNLGGPASDYARVSLDPPASTGVRKRSEPSSSKAINRAASEPIRKKTLASSWARKESFLRNSERKITQQDDSKFLRQGVDFLGARSNFKVQ